jgi:hypothetical protein
MHAEDIGERLLAESARSPVGQQIAPNVAL